MYNPFIFRKIILKMNFIVIVLSSIILAQSLKDTALVQIDSCHCQNFGVCHHQETQNVFSCSCGNDYLDRLCQIRGQQINNQQTIANITSQYSYFYATLNDSVLYLLQMYFCPLNFTEGSLFEVYIEFQAIDGSLTDSLTDKKVEIFPGISGQCLAFKSMLYPPDPKYTGQTPRLVIRLRRISQGGNLSRSTNTTSPTIEMPKKQNQNVSLVSIVIYQFALYELQSLKIGQFVAISLISSLLILTISILICRKRFLRGIRRYHYHPAQVTHQISHFDILMPSTYNPPQQQIDTKQCMICLLDVNDSFTRTTPCRHLFHKDCIDEWGRKSLTCPACRASLTGPNAEIPLHDMI